MRYPQTRLRRLRHHAQLRRLLSQHEVLVSDLVQPLFVKEGLNRPREIGAMPGQFQWSEKSIANEAKKIEALGLPAVLLFGIPAQKDTSGHIALHQRGLVQKTIATIKKQCPGLLVIADVCLCEYLSHGHCGHVKNGKVLNDASVKTLAKLALSYAQAGADVVAPSDMMDGRVQAIRRTLDTHGFDDIPILSYAVKYASSFYGPFREAAESAPKFGDRKSYQMDPASSDQALREAKLDLDEGADLLLVKPALGFGDILYRIKEAFQYPTGCYSVSGEYSMIKAAAQKGWLDEQKTVYETHLSFKRAGADFIVSYWAKNLAQWKLAKKGLSA